MEVFIIVTALWVFSVCLHEFGHAWVAYRGGDYTVRDKGYLTLNPLRYTHPVYSLVMPVVFVMLGGIGLPGGAVYIERHLLRSRAWDTWVSLAGPAMNLGFVILISLGFKLGWLRNDPESLSAVSLGFLLQLQVSALILNLLPVPPLDGFQALAPWLPADLRERLYGMSNYGLLIVVAALWLIEPVNRAFWSTIFQISSWLGVHPHLGIVGWRNFRFWEQGGF
ncbi:MAG: site-2 protease family protein [Verrucomicrobia bacterium]|nr:site-2 protease family protein [Verrucomicrobiota bacterium]